MTVQKWTRPDQKGVGAGLSEVFESRLSAKEPMNLVDKRLDKATAPRLLWVIIDRGSELCRPAQVRFAPKDGVIGRQLVDS
jgi:hypothetical protein